MNLIDIKKLLESTGYPVAYRCFAEKIKPPFICYLSPYSRNFSADSKTYVKIDHIQIELYTEKKDQSAEGKVENALSSLFWQKTEEFIKDEKMYQIIYEIEV
ncbi:MAG: hypothetical protein RR424_10920 [Oscillospiraceae bacterium]